MFECPDNSIWQQRRDWIDQEIENAERGVHCVSDHAVALLMKLLVVHNVEDTESGMEKSHPLSVFLIAISQFFLSFGFLSNSIKLVLIHFSNISKSK